MVIFFYWKSAAEWMSYLHAKREGLWFKKDGKAGASIMVVLVTEAVDTLAASLPGSG